MSDDYRQHYAEAYEQLSLGYAKTLVTLAGGALGLTLTFADKFVDKAADSGSCLLVLSWVLWAVALTSVLAGYYFGRQAALCAVHQADGGKFDGDKPEKAGGAWTPATHASGLISLLAFVGGVAIFIVFVSRTLG